MFNIAICEDDLALGTALLNILRSSGYQCELATCAEELDLIISRTHPSLLILDKQLPGESGPEIATRVLRNHPHLTVIMMSAIADLQSRIAGYNAGAIIYLAKPFEPVDLLAAVAGLSKQYNETKPSGIILESAKLALVTSGQEISLSAKEFTLLKLLAVRSPHPVETFELLEAITPENNELASKSSLEVTISRLRKKLDQARIDRSMINISSSHSLGYSLVGEVKLI